ncbi:hypothetical protein CAG99_27110 [Streptomyces marincola]|uniref:Beta-galactosidase C-terminal domain-containing protein n=1 Tax=Streptomyces marincola TaxID=2878388 RepID=A0A1W7D4U5_9ACTN|nr:hypothetical protein CAG99_27110 [Streptomyces marincola]
MWPRPSRCRTASRAPPAWSVSTARLDTGGTGTLWTDRVRGTGSDVAVLASWTTGPQAGRPAITRRPAGKGSAAYVSTRLGAEGLPGTLAALLDAAGIAAELPAALRGRVGLAIRGNGDEEFWFLVNRTDEPVALAGLDGEPLTGTRAGEPADTGPAHVLGPRGVLVLRRPAAAR